MKKKLLVSLALIIILSMSTITAFAGPPDNEVEGTWCYLPTNEMVPEFHGKNTFIYIEDDGEWTGTFSGMSKDIGTTIIHGGSGKWTYHAYVSFDEVTVNEVSGTLEMRVNGMFQDGLWEGRWVITGSGGELSGLQGQGTWEGPGYIGDGCGMTSYSGKIH